jgi:hypothetical protein
MQCMRLFCLSVHPIFDFRASRSHNLVDGIIEKHDNAFSIMLPGITQLGVLARADDNSVAAVGLRKSALSPDGARLPFVLLAVQRLNIVQKFVIILETAS